MLYSQTYNLEKMLNDHAQPVRYELPLPPSNARTAAAGPGTRKAADLYVHKPRPPRAVAQLQAGS
jgi:hypothetical protein